MPGKRTALIVASDRFSDAKLTRLRSPGTDASALAQVLSNPAIGNFDVSLSLNETESVVRRKLSTFFTKAGREDLLVLHIASHGVKDDDGNLYFATTDTETSDLLATAVGADLVERLIARSLSRRVVLLLDCCYSGAFARGMRARGDPDVHVLERFTGRGRAVLTASSAMEYAWEGDDVSGEGVPSVFTGAVVRALETGEADRDGDGYISVDELYDYVLERVRQTTPNQTPNKQIEMEGSLLLAQSVRGPRPLLTRLEPEVLDAARSSLAGVREGVVSELVRLLRSGDAGVVRAAEAVLAELATDDSRRVSAAATKALAGHAAAQPTSGLDAPEPPPQQTVTHLSIVAGPPITPIVSPAVVADATEPPAAPKPERTELADPVTPAMHRQLIRATWACTAASILSAYGFYGYGLLVFTLAPQFFPSEDATAGLLFALADLGAGFVARPVGALIFGRVGDRVGRKPAFVMSFGVMALTTGLVGLVPGYWGIGVLAPLLLVVLVLAQGLAMGGTYGGAVILLAERASGNQRGLYTSWIQASSTVGLAAALTTDLFGAQFVGSAFFDWGWRVPFCLSFVVGLPVWIYIRSRVPESPTFERLKATGTSSVSPIKDSFGSGRWRLILLAIFGVTVGQGIIWSQSQWQVRTVLLSSTGYDEVLRDVVLVVALLLTVPLYPICGSLSDRFGRKPVFLTGCFVAAVLYFPVYLLLGDTVWNLLPLVLLVFVQMVCVPIVFGPSAALLGEMFPTRVRYTALSISYQLGTAVFGGVLPFVWTFGLSALFYPVAAVVGTFVVGWTFLKETRHVRIGEFSTRTPVATPVE